MDAYDNNDSIGKTKAINQQKKFAGYVNPELVTYLKSQGILGVEGDGRNGVMIGVPNIDGTSSIWIVVSADRYYFYDSNSDVNSLKPEMISKLPTLIKRIQADLKGEKSRVNPAKTFESEPAIAQEGKVGDFVGGMVNKVNQSLGGKFAKQKELKAAIEADPTKPKGALSKAYASEIMYNAGLGSFIKQATPENALEVAQQAANDPDGLGKLSQQNGVLIYIPAKNVK